MSRASGGLHVAIERASYPVVGATAEALRTILQTLGPTRTGRTYAAFTDWEVSWDYGVEAAPERLRVSDVSVTVRAVVTVPRWRPPRSAPAALVEQWQQYLAAIDLHEQGHVNLAVEAGRCILARLEALPPFGDPEPLRRAVEAAAEAEIAAVRERERTYDETSDHGASQGATLSHDTRPR